MKIGIDARMYRSGVAGIGRYSQNLIKNLLGIDRENQYVLFMTSADAKEFASHSSRQTRTIKNWEIVIADIPHFSLAEQFQLPKIIEKEKLDLMHFLNFNHPVRYRGRFVVTIHDLTLFFYPQAARDINFIKHFGFRYVLKKAVENSAKIIVVSENTKKDVTQKLGINADKIQVIYEAADDSSLIANRISHIANSQNAINDKRYAISDMPIILSVGQFRRHKNIAGLLRAFKILREKMPCQLALIGGKKEDLRVDISHLSGDIKMPGFVSDEELAKWYEIASVFVFPSFYEGFGLPGLEAMAAGLPVVASNKSSLPEIYQDAAIYFDPFDPTDIADKIKLVLTDNKTRRRLIENGQRVSKLYSWRKAARRTLEVYKEMNSKFKVQNSKSKF